MKRWFLPILLVMILLNPVYAAFAETPESTVLTVACEEHDVRWMQKPLTASANSIRAWKCALKS